MATLLLIDEREATYVVSRRAQLWSIVRARVFSWSLDHALASGVSPDSDALLSLRARTLIGRRCRRGVARALRMTLCDARRPPTPLEPRLPTCREGVLSASRLMSEIAERLAGPGAVDARGVAQLRILLKDGLGPLYDRDASEAFVRALEDAGEALDPTP